MELTHEEWLKRRRSGIGGSDAAAVLGLSPWQTPLSIWLNKTGRKPLEDVPSVNMRIGTELEDLVARMYCEQTGHVVRRYNALLRDGCLVGNVDRLVCPDGHKIAAIKDRIIATRILECKTARNDWPDGVPLYYQTQVQHYMGLIPGAVATDVAVLHIGLHPSFEIYEVKRDDAVIQAMQTRLREWWRLFVEGDTPPPPATSDDAALLYPKSNPGAVSYASKEILSVLSELRTKRLERDAIDKEIATAETAIKSAMGDAELLKDDAGKVLASWKSSKPRERVDWQSIAKVAIEDLGWSEEETNDLISNNTTTGASSRRFLLK